MMGTICSFAAVSGLRAKDYHWLAHRYDAAHGFDPERCESIVGRSVDNYEGDAFFLPGWLTGLWRSERWVWTTHTSGFVYRNDSQSSDPASWTRRRLDASLSGIWGLRDDLLFAWGVRGTQPVLFLFDGSDWREIPSPGFVTAIHGSSEELLYLVGLRGLIARWNGQFFEPVASPTGKNITGVFVESEDEMFTCVRAPFFLSGGVHGWEEIPTGLEGASCVAKWNGEVWFGNEGAGLFKWKAGKLELEKEPVKATAFDARGDLLMSSEDSIFATTDGKKIFRFRAEWVEEDMASRP